MKSLFTFLSFFILFTGHAQWSNANNEFYDTLHMPVSTALREQTNSIVIRSYPDSGYIVIWQDERIVGNNTDIFAQKLDKNGNLLWTADGVPVITGPYDQQFKWSSNADYRNYSHACTDSANGFYIAAHDYNATGNGNRVVVQHIRADGSMVFPATGNIVAEGTASTYQYAFPQLFADGRKGFFIAYMRQSLGATDVIAKCMRDDNGVLLNLGGGQMDMNGINATENSPCGLRNVINYMDIYVQDFYIYPDLQGGCNVVMNMVQNMGGNERTFIGYNRLCRVKKDCRTTTLHRTSSLTTVEAVEKIYHKDDIVQLYNFTTFFDTKTCGDLAGNLYVVTSYYVENLGNGFMPVNNLVYNTSYVRGVVLPTDGNIYADIITASERSLINGTTPSQYAVRAYYRYNEKYDSLPYELCSKVDIPYMAIRPSPEGTVLDRINFGEDTLIASSIYEYDYSLVATGNRVLATKLEYIQATGERRVALQQLRLQRMSSDSFAIVHATNDKKGITIGKEIYTGFQGNSISYDYPRIAVDNNGHALFYIREYYRYVRVSPIGEQGNLLWGAMGRPIGSGVYHNSFMQPDYPYALMNADGTGVIGWHDNRFLGTDGSNNIYARRLDYLNNGSLPPVKKTVVLPLLVATPANPEIMTGTSHQFTTFHTYNSTTGTVSPVVEISDDYDLGAVNVSTYQHSGTSRLLAGKPFLHRNYKISVEHNPAGAANIHVRLYFTQQDFDLMKAADPTVQTPAHLQVIKQEDNTASYAPPGYTPVAGETRLTPVSWSAVDGGYYIEIIVNSFSNFFVVPSNNIALPVVWLNVQAEWSTDTQARISWEVAQEQNVKDYTVQVSTDGTQFTNICTVQAQHQVHYHCMVPAGNASIYYFRVIQTDEDGRSTRSKVVSLQRRDENHTLSIVPNPAVNGIATIRYITGNDRITQLALVNSNGMVLWKQRVNLKGSGSYVLPVLAIPKGIYNLQVLRNERWENLKMIVH